MNILTVLTFKTVFSGFVAASCIAFYLPNLLHHRKQYKHEPFMQILSNQAILRISHRGGPRQITQNTIQAFRNSEAISDMMQMDVCLTKDGVLVVHHDKDLQRTCGINAKVQDLDYQQLPIFKKQIEIHFAEKGRTVKSKGQTIPTLQQTFKALPFMPMDIELKTPSDQAIKQLARLITTYNRTNITIVGIRNHWQEQLKKTDSNLQLFCNDKAITKLMAAYFTGLLPFIKISETSLQLPLYTKDFHDWKKREWGDTYKTSLFFMALKLLNYALRPMIWHLRKRGVMTYYWVCNNQQEYKRAIEGGACGIMTDDPVLLNDYLAKRNLIIHQSKSQ